MLWSFSRPLRVALASVLVPMLLNADVTHSEARGAADVPPPAERQEVNPALRQAVEKGLARLAQMVNQPGDPGGGHSDMVAEAAFEGLAFVIAGNEPDKGPYGAEVRKCLDITLANCQPNGLIAISNDSSPMYGHGFSMLFLAEVCTRTNDAELKQTLRSKLGKAVALTIKAESQEGGWRYRPEPLDSDVSVTACQLVGLGAARGADVEVNKDVIARGVAYVLKCQLKNGGFSYVPGPNSGSVPPRSAAAVVALCTADADEFAIERGLRYLAPYVAPLTPGREATDFYAAYYHGEVLALAGRGYRAEHRHALIESVLAAQNKDGGWHGTYTDEYSTAMSLLALQLPDGKLQSLAHHIK